jgi:hypothetical protein
MILSNKSMSPEYTGTQRLPEARPEYWLGHLSLCISIAFSTTTYQAFIWTAKLANNMTKLRQICWPDAYATSELSLFSAELIIRKTSLIKKKPTTTAYAIKSGWISCVMNQVCLVFTCPSMKNSRPLSRVISGRGYTQLVFLAKRLLWSSHHFSLINHPWKLIRWSVKLITSNKFKKLWIKSSIN